MSVIPAKRVAAVVVVVAFVVAVAAVQCIVDMRVERGRGSWEK